MFNVLKKSITLLALVISVVSNVYANSANLSVAVGIENYDFKPFFDEFTHKTGIQIDVMAFENNELKSQLLQKANSASLPDVVIVPSDYLGLEQLQFSTIPDNWLNQALNPKARESTKHGSGYKGIPFIFGNHLLLYYNKKWIKEPPKTWTELLNLAPKLPLGKELIAWNYFEMYWFAAFYNSFDEPLIRAGYATIDPEAMISSLLMYDELKQKSHLDIECNYSCMVEKFESGNVSMVINGSWIFNKWMDKMGEDIGVANLPAYHTRPMRSFYSPHVIAFPNDGIEGKKKALLKAFSQFIQSSQVQNQVWARLHTLPVRQDTLDKLSHNDSNLQLLIDGLENTVALPNDTAMAYVWEAMLKGITRYEAGIMNAAQAADYMQYVTNKSINHAKQKHSN
ncbi:extracellular solute-binding protein (plasmid) [Pseudoalteromonas xiamenensis]|uniref:sugar ABC transporter substrate-binding protein n=1 Tax=Pseudoalteromonas xiamenensis TaxID=882626 RepID=UPI0027E42FBA|nr:extracellular solute-binding protein [Pseudoalteromonas xiamenensis]WMN61810.1 extracellular solute-binding protein [Pseudoalteromonas xiamenensis]